MKRPGPAIRAMYDSDLHQPLSQCVEMTRYQIGKGPSAVSNRVDRGRGHQKELLEAFEECQEGSCTCPTDEVLEERSSGCISCLCI